MGRKKHFFPAEAARSVFSIAQGTAAKDYGDGWNDPLRASEVITRFLKVPVPRDKLRLSDSELWTFDSERWNGVFANAVCTDQSNLTCRTVPTTCLKLRIPDSGLRISDSSTGIFDSAASEVVALMPVWHAGNVLE